jgi:hypothetical protein
VPGSVTQLRQRWCREWKAGQGEDVIDSGRESGRNRKAKVMA